MKKPQGLRFGPPGAHCLHLCIDMQRLLERGAPWHAPWLERVLPRVERLVRHRPERTLFTRFMPPARPSDCEGGWRRFYERWSELTLDRIDPALLELVAPLAGLAGPGQLLDKPGYSPFHATGLDARLRRDGIDTVLFSGSETDVCIAAAVLDAVDLGYRAIVVADAVCSSADETHDAQMTLYRSRFSQQVEVAEVEEIIGVWE